MARYVELHCHSSFSFREGASTPLELVLQARKLGYGALALTDHDGLAGAMEFAQTAKEWDVKPIIGAEVTLRPSPPAPLPRAGEGWPKAGVRAAHLTLLAATPRGYANLSRLLSAALLSSPRDEPALDPEALAGKAEGLIALSGCPQGAVPRCITQYDAAGARRMAERYVELFGRESFFIELQNNLVYGDTRRNRGLVELARELGVGIVATNNVHYHEHERHRLQDVLVAVRHRTTLDASERVRRKNAEFYLKSPAEMAALFAELPEALQNTLAIAERCDPSAGSGQAPSAGSGQAPSTGSGPGFDLTKDLTYRFPDFEAPGGKSADDYLAEICRASERELYGWSAPQIDERLR